MIKVMDQFHQVFPRAETAFGKGFMTGMLLLGAFVGGLFMADKIYVVLDFSGVGPR